MNNELPSGHAEHLSSMNIVPLHGHFFQEHTFRSREPRREEPFSLAGRIQNRDRVFIANTNALPASVID